MVTAEKMDKINQLNTEIVQLGRQYVSSSQFSEYVFYFLFLLVPVFDY